jgi:hypothetical protein
LRERSATPESWMPFMLSMCGKIPCMRAPLWKPSPQETRSRSRAASTSEARKRTARPGNHHVDRAGVLRRRARVGDDHREPWRDRRRRGVSAAGVAPPPLREAHATHAPATAEPGGTDATALEILHRPTTFSIGISSHAATVHPSRKKHQTRLLMGLRLNHEAIISGKPANARPGRCGVLSGYRRIT